MSEQKTRDVATVAQCLLCDSFYMLVIDVIPHITSKGKQAAQLQEDLLAEMQEMYANLSLFVLVTRVMRSAV